MTDDNYDDVAIIQFQSGANVYDVTTIAEILGDEYAIDEEMDKGRITIKA